jgi:hypothetical protein
MKLKVWYGKEWDHGKPQKYVFVKEIEASDYDDAYFQMQGENWSPNGEAQPLLYAKSLHHTSMSVGDILETEEGTLIMVVGCGFKEVSEFPKIVNRWL